ncbi:proteasome subunit beta [Natronosalvus rutilus]|uniref:proteasome endopeptidase complex n=1 Tax=Natronosalvus rutilus TaxID=2953753 RepID=A0A9E7N630_9EURY|nr:proteasome subunit beta [Natronosalvus rutilus]UTF52409.1 proteasome subunit beta [Natronosalvus rutilus]
MTRYHSKHDSRPGSDSRPDSDSQTANDSQPGLEFGERFSTLGSRTKPFAQHAPATGGGDTHELEFSTGTTIVGIRATDGVVMAADQRMSLGGRFTANKDVRKISAVHPTAAMAISGSVGPAQEVIRRLRAEASLYESRRGEPMSLPALARTAGALVRGLPVAPLLCGVDETGGHVYELDGGGSVVEDHYAAGGSGMQVAYGVLEGRLEDDPAPELETATDAAVAAVEAASERDTASGDGVTTATITADGVTVDQRRAS